MSGWWQMRSPREQMLLGVMGALFVLLLIWLLIARPLSDKLDAAKRRHADAALLLATARARAHPLQAGGAPATGPAEAIVARTASAAGFANARIASQGPGRAVATLDAARPQALFAWVAAMEQNGLIVERLRATANEDHSLAAELTLRGGR